MVLGKGSGNLIHGELSSMLIGQILLFGNCTAMASYILIQKVMIFSSGEFSTSHPSIVEILMEMGKLCFPNDESSGCCEI